jgi:putative transposase
MRTSYHTHLKVAVRLGVCPVRVQDQLPKSNFYRWRGEHHDKYYSAGLELEKYTRLLETVQMSPGTFYAYARLVRTFINCFVKASGFFTQLSSHKEEIVRVVKSVKDIVPVKKAVRIFNISIHTFRAWQTQVDFPCAKSVLKACLSFHPGQLTLRETSQMEKLLLDERFRHWSIASIHHYARRSGLVSASLNTWYKYNRLMKWRKTRGKQKCKHYTPLIAGHPNHYWHLDVTRYRSIDGNIHYIHALMDNFSRKTLAWDVQRKLCGLTSVELLGKAKSLAEGIYGNIAPTLIVDGGPENNNILVEDFISKSPIVKLVAQSDIPSSNSMVEAKNKKIKYEWLYRKSIPDASALRKELEKFFEEDNNIKPLHALGGFTPDEIYLEKKNPLDSPYHTDLKIAQQARKQLNRQNRCGICGTK